MRTRIRAMLSSVSGLIAFGLVLFLPAGTFHYWQAWVFIAAFTAATIIPSIYLAKTDPAALQRRMHGGPFTEARAIQKLIIIGVFLTFFAMMALSAFDHRLGWSTVPTALCLIGDAVMVAGLVTAMLVVVQNSYAAATVGRKSTWRRRRMLDQFAAQQDIAFSCVAIAVGGSSPRV